MSDEAKEIERLITAIHERPDGWSCVHVDALAILARRLLAERDDYQAAMSNLATEARVAVETCGNQRERIASLEQHICYDDDGKLVGTHRWVTYHEYPNSYSTDDSPKPHKAWCPACGIIKTRLERRNERLENEVRRLSALLGVGK